jgi:hypothetical protein
VVTAAPERDAVWVADSAAREAFRPFVRVLQPDEPAIVAASRAPSYPVHGKFREEGAIVIKMLRAARFLFVGPLVLLVLVVVNVLTSPGDWWVQWPALVIGIIWVISLVRVLAALILVGGLAAIGAYLFRNR